MEAIFDSSIVFIEILLLFIGILGCIGVIPCMLSDKYNNSECSYWQYISKSIVSILCGIIIVCASIKLDSWDDNRYTFIYGEENCPILKHELGKPHTHTVLKYKIKKPEGYVFKKQKD